MAESNEEKKSVGLTQDMSLVTDCIMYWYYEVLYGQATAAHAKGYPPTSNPMSWVDIKRRYALHYRLEYSNCLNP